MAAAAGYVLKVAEQRQQILADCIGEGVPFAEPVDDFNHSRNVALIAFLSTTPGAVTHVGKARRGMKAGTGLRRLNVSEIVPLPTPIRYAGIARRVDNRVRPHVKRYLKYGGLISTKSFHGIVDAIRELAPTTRPLLDRYSQERANVIRDLSAGRRRALAFQKEAVLAAVAAANLPKELLLDWSPPTDMERGSFLDGLSQVRLREDPMVLNDLLQVPGFQFLRLEPFGAAVFDGDGVRLTLVLANRLPLEEQFGADLVYYNETYKSFVMVQYKAMEADNHGHLFRLPNAQLALEIARMQEVLIELDKCAPNNHRDGYRLTENPFFLKLCPRLVFNPDAVGLVPGMYLPLDYWYLIDADQTLVGPGGGRQVRFENVGRHLTNSDFVQLVERAWVGTTQVQSAFLAPIVRQVIESGRTVVLAIKTDTRDPSPSTLGTDTPFDPTAEAEVGEEFQHLLTTDC